MTRSLLAVGTLVGVLIGGCGDDDSSAPASRWARAVAGLCAAADQARGGDVDAARGTFFDQAHDDLHELADEVAREDRSAAAALLEAKETVESGLDSSVPPVAMADDLDALVAATRAAVDATGALVPAGCS